MRALKLAVVAALAIVAAGTTGATATPRADSALLAFSVDSRLGLCATDLQGHTFRLTDPNQSGAWTTWSPDGSQLAFMSSPTRLNFVDADGRNKGTLWWPGGDGEHYSSNVSGLAWSPDSRSLAGVISTAYKYGGVQSQLWVNDGTSRTLYQGTEIGQPSWSPDGSRIAFSESATRKAYIVDVDGSNLREVLDSADQPVWSPDGQRLAYVVLSAEGESVGLSVARADGSGERLLTEGRVLSPAWSPDGSTIAFTRNLGTSAQIEVIKPDGKDERTVAGAAAGFPGPAWSPEGDAIAYVTAEEPPAITVVDSDGTNKRIVETGLPGARLSFPAWRRPAPLPTKRRRCVVTGTTRADVLRGTNRGDVLYGGAGNDWIGAANGDDVIFGGAGRDEIHAAGGGDYLVGGPGHDLLYGGSGYDFFDAYDGIRDSLFGGPGPDRGSWDLNLDRRTSVERYVHPG